MTNPGNAVGTNGAYGGRTSVNAFNDVLAGFSGRGIVSGWACVPNNGLTISLGGNGISRDVAFAEDDAGNKTTINNRSGVPIDLTLTEAPTLGSRIDTIVAYVNNPPEGDSATVDNPSACGLIAVAGAVSNTPVAPTEDEIRTAITSDGGAGVTAYYVILATVTVLEGATDIVADNIVSGSTIGTGTVDGILSTTSENPVQNKVITAALNELNDEIGDVNAALIRLNTGIGVEIPDEGGGGGGGGGGEVGSNLSDLQTAVRAGQGPELFPVGTEIPDTWNGEDQPLVIVSYQEIKDESGTAHNGAILQRKYATTGGVAYATDPTGMNTPSAATYYQYLQGDYYEKSSDAVKEVLSECLAPLFSYPPAVYSSTKCKWFMPVGANLMTEATRTDYGFTPWAYWQSLIPSANANASSQRILKTSSGTAVPCWLTEGRDSSSAYVINSDGSKQALARDNANVHILPCFAIY